MLHLGTCDQGPRCPEPRAARSGIGSGIDKAIRRVCASGRESLAAAGKQHRAVAHGGDEAKCAVEALGAEHIAAARKHALPLCTARICQLPVRPRRAVEDPGLGPRTMMSGASGIEPLARLSLGFGGRRRLVARTDVLRGRAARKRDAHCQRESRPPHALSVYRRGRARATQWSWPPVPKLSGEPAKPRDLRALATRECRGRTPMPRLLAEGNGGAIEPARPVDGSDRVIRLLQVRGAMSPGRRSC